MLHNGFLIISRNLNYSNQFKVFNYPFLLISGAIYSNVQITSFPYPKKDSTGKWGYFDSKTNEWIIPQKYTSADYFGVTNEFAVVKIDNKFGLIDKKGIETIPLMYQFVYYFDTGTDDPIGVLLNGLLGFVNFQNKEITPFKYHNIGGFENRFAAVKYNNHWGAINRQGKEIILPKYDWLSKFDKNGIAKAGLNEKCGSVDTLGNITGDFDICPDKKLK